MAGFPESRKRSFDEVDDESCSLSSTPKILKLDLSQSTSTHQPTPQPRILPFRASPTSKHTLSFSQCTRARPATLISASGALTPGSSEDEGTSCGFFLPTPPQLDLQTPPRTQSSTKSRFDAFSRMRETTDTDIDMVDSPAPASFPWTSPAATPLSPPFQPCDIQMATPPSPSSSRIMLATPPPPRPIPFKLQPLPRPDQIHGGRIPTPTYGHFQLPKSDENRSPMTRQKGSFLRRGACPPSPISEDEFSSPSTFTRGLLGKLNIGSPSWLRTGNSENHIRSGFGNINESGNRGYRAMGIISEVAGISV